MKVVPLLPARLQQRVTAWAAHDAAPKRLAEKLLQIRASLNLSQSEMATRLEVTRKHVSRYERNQSEPPIEVLLAYGRPMGVRLEQIVDDEMELNL